VSQVKWNVEHLGDVDSTNTWLAARAREGAAQGLVVYCDFQRAGRGRLERQWCAPANSSLLCSVLLTAPAPLVAPQWIVVAAALALCDALELLTARRPVLKWPNDVLYGESKVAGLLAEVVSTDTGLKVVIGMGVNLTDVDPSIARATSVLAATGVSLAPAQLLRSFLDALAQRQSALDSPEGRADLSEKYARSLSTLGRRVRVELTDGFVNGVAVDVDPDGALRVDTGSDVRAFSAGDVVHLRREDDV